VYSWLSGCRLFGLWFIHAQFFNLPSIHKIMHCKYVHNIWLIRSCVTHLLACARAHREWEVCEKNTFLSLCLIKLDKIQSLDYLCFSIVHTSPSPPFVRIIKSTLYVTFSNCKWNQNLAAGLCKPCIMKLLPLFASLCICNLLQWMKAEKQRTHSVHLLTWQRKRDCKFGIWDFIFGCTRLVSGV
jgi:hypothetical protein